MGIYALCLALLREGTVGCLGFVEWISGGWFAGYGWVFFVAVVARWGVVLRWRWCLRGYGGAIVGGGLKAMALLTVVVLWWSGRPCCCGVDGVEVQAAVGQLNGGFEVSTAVLHLFGPGFSRVFFSVWAAWCSGLGSLGPSLILFLLLYFIFL